jgi:hypothetical protein
MEARISGRKLPDLLWILIIMSTTEQWTIFVVNGAILLHGMDLLQIWLLWNMIGNENLITNVLLIPK